jgi:DNA-binding NtrC family response regulator
MCAWWPPPASTWRGGTCGRFNERLYQYLREGALELPPLRERPGDILPLAEYFVGIYSVRLQRPVPLISEAAQQVRKRILAGQYPRAGERHPLCLAGE